MILLTLCALAFSACKVTTEPADNGLAVTQASTATSKVSIVDSWLVPQPSGMVRDLIAITFVVRNAGTTDAKVKVVCNRAEGELFGESLPQTVRAGAEAKLMVRGFNRCPKGGECHESFECRVEPMR